MRKGQMITFVLCGALLALFLSCASSGGGASTSGTWEWEVDNDASNGGNSTITMSEETIEGLPARSFKGNITNKYQYGDVYARMLPDDVTLEQLKKAKAISFRFQGDGDQFGVKLPTTNVTDYAWFEYDFETKEGQPQTVIVPVEFFMQPSWGKAVSASLNTELIKFVEFQTKHNGNPGPFEFKVWDFRIHTNGVPKEKDVLPKGAAKPAAAKAAPAEEKPIGGDFSPMEIRLADNFEYGDNYQAVIADKRLFNGHKIVPGEKYTLKITYTASRDLENVVEVGLVDTTPQAYKSYWGALSFRDGADTGAPDGMAVLPKSKKDEVVSATIKLTTTQTASGSSALANALVFGSKGAGRKGTKGSGVQKAVVLNCTEFVFTKD